MVRNTQGGGRAKGLARKHVNSNKQGGGKLRLPVEEGEQIACVTKMFGNGMCEIYNNDNVKLIGHIRGSMRGRQKRHNKIVPSMLVLIGLRTWESTLKNCDILCIYNEEEVEQLKNIPNVSLNTVLDIRNNNMGITKHEADIVNFDLEEEDEEEIDNKIKTEDFKWEQTEDVDIDDI